MLTKVIIPFMAILGTMVSSFYSHGHPLSFIIAAPILFACSMINHSVMWSAAFEIGGWRDRDFWFQIGESAMNAVAAAFMAYFVGVAMAIVIPAVV